MIPPFGVVSYTEFLKGVKNNLIKKVLFIGNQQQAHFLNINGEKGFVNLFNDPQLLKILQDNNVDISVIYKNSGNIFLDILSFFAFPLIYLIGISILRKIFTGRFMNNEMNTGKSKAKT